MCGAFCIVRGAAQGGLSLEVRLRYDSDGGRGGQGASTDRQAGWWFGEVRSDFGRNAPKGLIVRGGTQTLAQDGRYIDGYCPKRRGQDDTVHYPPREGLLGAAGHRCAGVLRAVGKMSHLNSPAFAEVNDRTVKARQRKSRV